MAIGKAGARNAAIFALQIMASKDTSVREKLAQFRSDLKKEVEKKDKQLQKR
jgi:5-(carboxyamino)imidazole ribonucleotide mutase